VSFRSGFSDTKNKRIPFLKNEPEKLLKTKGQATWIAKNEPENEPEKLLKTRSCGKNEPKTNRKMNRAVMFQNWCYSAPFFYGRDADAVVAIKAQPFKLIFRSCRG